MRTIKTKLAIAGAVVGMLVSAGSAMAAPGQATGNVNVRTGPGVSYAKVDTLFTGEEVEVVQCQGSWCYVEHSGPDGWVSKNYLAIGSGGGGGGGSGGGSTPNPLEDCYISVGPGGLSAGCGAPPSGTPTPTPVGDAACFYTGPGYTGDEFCEGTGTFNALNATFNDRISSVRLFGAAKAKLCRNTNLTGICATASSDVPNLPAVIDDKASSLIIFTGAGPDDTPATHSTGPINLPQSFTANLDNGNVGGAGADIWYHAINPVSKYLETRNGALVALGDGSNRGYEGCAAESFSASAIPLASLSAGTYVCVKTNQGRISQFRVNGFTGTTMHIGYTTWAN